MKSSKILITIKPENITPANSKSLIQRMKERYGIDPNKEDPQVTALMRAIRTIK